MVLIVQPLYSGTAAQLIPTDLSPRGGGGGLNEFHLKVTEVIEKGSRLGFIRKKTNGERERKLSASGLPFLFYY